MLSSFSALGKELVRYQGDLPVLAVMTTAVVPTRFFA